MSVNAAPYQAVDSEEEEQQDVKRSKEHKVIINRGWRASLEGKRFANHMFSGRENAVMGVLEKPDVGLSVALEVREVKVAVFGKQAAGKTAFIANMCNSEIPVSHVETAGIQVIGTFWPVQFPNGRIVIFKYKFWDCGAGGMNKYQYLQQAVSVKPQIIVFVFAINDRESFEQLNKQVLQSMEDPERQKTIKIIVATKTDCVMQSQIHREELSNLSLKCKIPVYFVRNINATSADEAQNEKDVMKIKNDMAEFLLCEDDSKIKEYLFTNTSRFKVKDIPVPQAPAPTTPTPGLHVANPMRVLSLLSRNASARDLASQAAAAQESTLHTTKRIVQASDGDEFVVVEEFDDNIAVEGEHHHHDHHGSNRNKTNTSNNNHNVENKPLRGPLMIDKKSQTSYELVYDMLTGIKNAVVETFAKRATREEELELNYSIQHLIVLIPKDFTTTHTYSYTADDDDEDESEGGRRNKEAVQYSFKFVDYAPFVFYNIRAHYGFNTTDYLDSLTKQIALHELRSPGKSGSFFYYSLDYKFIIKTVTEQEAEFFMQFLTNYYQYISRNPNTLICKFFGLHMVQPINSKEFSSKEMYFIVMDNTFQPAYEIHERYDLKGSTVGRFASEQEKGANNCILKDLDIQKKRRIRLGPENKKKLLEQLEKDTKLLEENKVMDYSFLVGVHKDYKINQSGDADAPEPERKSSEILSYFKKDDGGLHSELTNELYFFTIIDVFTEWTVKKRMENSFKSLVYESTGISAVHPTLYRERFLKFLNEIVE